MKNFALTIFQDYQISLNFTRVTKVTRALYVKNGLN
jgi:hypothetical protein